MITHRTETFLKRHGFFEERRVTHGAFWSDGVSRILVGREAAHAGRNYQNFLATVRRAVKKRQEAKCKQEKHKMESTVLVKKANGDATKVLHIAKPDPVRLDPPKVDADTSSQRRTSRRFDNTMKQLLKVRIEELIDDGIKAVPEIRSKLNQEKFTMTDGEALTDGVVRYFVTMVQNEMAVKKLRANPSPQVHPTPSPQAPPPKPTPAIPDGGLPLWAMQIIRRTDWSAEKKVRVLLAWAED